MKKVKYILHLSISLILTIGVYTTANLVVFIFLGKLDPVHLISMLLPCLIIFNLIISFLNDHDKRLAKILSIEETERRTKESSRRIDNQKLLELLNKLNQQLNKADYEPRDNIIPFKKNTKVPK